MTARAWAASPPMCAARAARRMRPVLIAGNVVAAPASLAHRRAAAAGDGRAGPQPRAAARRAAARGGDRMGDGADRDRLARSASPIRGFTTPSTACSPRSRRRRRPAAGAPRWCASSCCCSPSSASASTSIAARSPIPPTIWSRSARARAARSAPAAAEPYGGNLLPLPRFVREGGPASWADIVAGLELTGHFLERDFLTERARAVGDRRARLVERLRRAGD